VNSFLYALLTEIAKIVLLLCLFVFVALFRETPVGSGPRDATHAERGH
jgi:hypothetical protein